MSISHAISHQIRRSAESKAHINLRNDELPLDGAATDLLYKLKSSFFSRISREHGSFDSAEQASPLSEAVENMLANDDRFIAETVKLAERFAQGLDDADIALSAYLLIFVERSEQYHALYLFVAQQKMHLLLDGDLSVAQCAGIDFGQSLFGIKVDIHEWKKTQHYSYLSSLLPKGSPGLAELFQAITGFGHGIDKSEETTTFLEAVENYAAELPADSVDDYRSQVVEYCLEREREDAPVDVRELSFALNDIDRDAFYQSVQQEQPIRMDKRSLQRYVKFSGRERDLAISFSSQQLNRRVRYDADSDTLSINGLPRALRDQLLGHLKRS